MGTLINLSQVATSQQAEYLKLTKSLSATKGMLVHDRSYAQKVIEQKFAFFTPIQLLIVSIYLFNYMLWINNNHSKIK